MLPADVEQGADLRQPEVSIAMQELRKRGWIKKQDMKNNGKGRPVHIYKPSMQLSKIVENFEQEKLKEIVEECGIHKGITKKELQNAMVDCVGPKMRETRKKPVYPIPSCSRTFLVILLCSVKSIVLPFFLKTMQ